ncbi:unnamed protein product [Thelazia callipaeda]|uniref:SER_THR_PHOSPHATASE domain-containing protein n=1 Tax=Thelazia callipaeda TaxID=103827 RepID=A0A158RC23_THECL|nr:unnamed protein product [Thelazia callipaeda]
MVSASGCAIILLASFTVLPSMLSAIQCGSEYHPFDCNDRWMCIAMRESQIKRIKFSFRCDVLGMCSQECTELSTHDWCLIRNLTHDIKCCKNDYCNWEEEPLFAATKGDFHFLPGTELAAKVIIHVVILIFIIYPILTAIITECKLRKYRKIEYNPEFNANLLQPENIEFRDPVVKTGEPLDGCLNFDEFAEVMKGMAEYRAEDDKPEVTLPTQSVNYMGCEVHESLGFDYAIIIRVEPTKFESLLIRMIEQGPGFFNIEGAELYELLLELSEIFRTENSLLEIPADVVVIGEIRGRYSDLLRWFQLYGYPPRRRYLFLGGIIDQECAESIETLAFLAAYKITTPHHVFIIRGATEFFPFHIRKRFPVKLNTVLSAFITRICSEMPIAATVGNKILAVHSGISSKLKNLNAIKNIDRPPLSWKCRIPYDLAFGAPSSGIKMYQKIKGSRGHFFGAKAVEELIKQLQVELIIRTHTPYQKGYFMFASGRVLSIWSGNSHDVKLATTIYIDSKLRIKVHSITPVEVRTVTN